MHTREDLTRRPSLVHRDRQVGQAGARLGHRPDGRHDGAGHGLPRRAARARASTSSRSPWTTASTPTPRAASPAASSSAKASRPRRKCSPAASSTGRSVRSSPPAGATKRRSSRMVLSADTENDSDVLAITGASAALALSEIPFEKTIAGVRVGLHRRPVRHQPDLRAAPAEPPRPGGRRQPRRHRDGRGGRQGSDRRGGRSTALDEAAQGHQADLRQHRRPGAGERQAQAPAPPSGPSATSSTARSKSKVARRR